ncbi:FTR1 family protein, partial [Rhodoluna sp.]|uniref:FTR1 family protein n=1 Tax=Rhodoluna sp. TaxID=1969481 RepID=UPI0025F46BDA
MLANYLIGIREGLEAALIVSILVAYLVKLNQREKLPTLFAGVIAAVLASVGIGLLLTFLVTDAPEGINEFIAGLASFIAVGFVTWM